MSVCSPLAKLVVRKISEEPVNEAIEDAHKNLLRFAIGSESEKRLRAMVSLVKSEPGLAVSIHSFNPTTISV